MLGFFPLPYQSNTSLKEKKVFRSLIASSIKEGDCSYAWKFVAYHCANGISQIKGIDFDQSYSPVAHANSFRINIVIASINRLTDRILDISNAFKNKNVPIHERVCVSTPPYYLDCFKISYPNVSINQYDGPFCLQCMNFIQVTKPAGRQWNIILDSVVTIIKYKKSKIDHDIFIKAFTDGRVSYLTVSIEDVLNNTNNETAFTELTSAFQEQFEMKVQEVSVIKYLNFRIFQSPLGFSVDNTDKIMELGISYTYSIFYTNRSTLFLEPF